MCAAISRSFLPTVLTSVWLSLAVAGEYQQDTAVEAQAAPSTYALSSWAVGRRRLAYASLTECNGKANSEFSSPRLGLAPAKEQLGRRLSTAPFSEVG